MENHPDAALKRANRGSGGIISVAYRFDLELVLDGELYPPDT
jgi:hypothetical protein